MTFEGHWQTMAITLAAVAVIIGAGSAVILTVSSAPSGPASLSLTIEFNPTSWYLTVTPSMLQAPAHSVLHFRITNYDPTSRDLAAPFCNVTGTVGGTMEESEAAGSAARTVSGLDCANVSHTFTMTTGGYDLNIPIPPAVASSSPSVVQFSIETLSAGVTPWASEATVAGPHGSSGTVTGYLDAT